MSKYVSTWVLSISLDTVFLESSTVVIFLDMDELMLSHLSFKWSGQIQSMDL